MSYLTEGRCYLIRRVLWGDGLSWGEQAVRQLAFATLRICAPRACVFCCPSHRTRVVFRARGLLCVPGVRCVPSVRGGLPLSAVLCVARRPNPLLLILVINIYGA